MFEHTQKLFFRRRPSRSIRPTGIRCFATLVEDISCFATLVEDISCLTTSVADIREAFLEEIRPKGIRVSHILAMKLQMFLIFRKKLV
jgi:hypothetical protein